MSNHCQLCDKDLGTEDEYDDDLCPECALLCSDCLGEGMMEAWWEMPSAHGLYREVPCFRCNGTGKEPQEDSDE